MIRHAPNGWDLKVQDLLYEIEKFPIIVAAPAGAADAKIYLVAARGR